MYWSNVPGITPDLLKQEWSVALWIVKYQFSADIFPGEEDSHT